MQAGIDKDTLDRLVARGRRQGALTNEDLREVLPVADMRADDIALVVAHLEDAGIPVELDESLLSPGAAPTRIERPGAEIVPLPERTARQPAQRSGADRIDTAAAAPPGATAPVTRDAPDAHWAVAIAGILVVVILGAFLIA